MRARLVTVHMDWFLAAALVAVLVLGACTNDPSADRLGELSSLSESPATAPSPAASADAADDIDVTTSPDEISPAWVSAVVNALLAEYGEMTAEILAMPVADDPTLPDGLDEELDQLFDGEYLQRRRRALQDILTNQDDLRDQLLPPDEYGGLRFFADIVQYSQERCIVAVGRISRELTIPGGGFLEELSAVSLTPAPAAASREGTSPRWVILDELANFGADGTPNTDAYMLDATLDDYEGALDNTCDDALP